MNWLPEGRNFPWLSRENAMPIYEYHCPQCRHQFELLVRAGELPRCPQCGADQLEKQLSVPAVSVASGQLPISAQGGSCGRPECGFGGCQGF
jgi:putative FmdB family regulatory protein